VKLLRNVVALSLAMFLCFGCASAKKKDGWVSNAPAGASQEGPGAYSPKRMATTDSTAVDLARIRRIYDDRTTGSGSGDYPIGTGDLIVISVPAMTELEEETVRVTSSGTVTLPMVGDVKAAGLTEKQFKSELQKALEKYMHRPHVAVHVTEYRSRQVGVLGAVDDPGLHTLKASDATILDMISEAGGLTDEASQRLLFIPVERVDPDEMQELSLGGLVTDDLAAGDITSLEDQPLLQASDPIIIDLDKMNRRSQRFALAVPVRPGDTIMALGGGQVFVQGWVETPGAQKMTRGLTLLGAIAAAGGPSFPAKKSKVEILRDDGGTQRMVRVVDLTAIEEGKAEDIALREGDLVMVESEAVRLVGYGVYRFFSEVMRVGVSVASPF
jgi:polysaccharide export outer membrane protein